jgi:hypothetical protein
MLCAYATRNPEYIIALTPEDWEAFAKARLRLRRDESFEFSLSIEDYESLVLRVTGISLWGSTSPQEVREMAEALNKYSPQELLKLCGRGYTEEEMESLQRFFNICVQRGLGLVTRLEFA